MKKAFIQLVLKPEEKELIRAEADKRGQKMSTFIKRAIMAHIENGGK